MFGRDWRLSAEDSTGNTVQGVCEVPVRTGGAMDGLRTHPGPKHAAVDPADLQDVQGMDFSAYVYKSRRGVKRGDDTKDTHKLPHRLIEKKRRDRINECISQLKDLLPEHLKLTTLGHLEKAVVLELTLKHVKALSALLDQQQQQILELQKDQSIITDHGDGAESDEEMFRSGFHMCAKEVLHYLSGQDSRRHLTPSHVIGHIHKVAAEVLQRRSGRPTVDSDRPGSEDPKEPAPRQRASEGPAKNCVPVIQRTYPHGTSEQSGSDTDTDSGYGGEHDKPKAPWAGGDGQRKHAACDRTAVKHEGDEPLAKKSRCDSSGDEPVSGTSTGGGFTGFPANQHPFCLPFYLLPPTAAAAAAAYLPMLEKYWYPGGLPVMYPGVSSLPADTPPLVSDDSALATDSPKRRPDLRPRCRLRRCRADDPAADVMMFLL
ncbi:class E basic helix-loop-helix protein 40-like [Lampetra planeri]